MATFAALFLLALAAGCRGFFVNPTLTSLAVSPTSASLIKAQTQQLSATGNYDDGSTKDLTGSADLDHLRFDGGHRQPGWFSYRSRDHRQPSGHCDHHRHFRHAHRHLHDHGKHRALLSIALTSFNHQPNRRLDLYFDRDGDIFRQQSAQDITSQVTWSNDNTTAVSLSQGSGSATANTGTSGQIAHIFATLNGINSNTVTITVQ